MPRLLAEEGTAAALHEVQVRVDLGKTRLVGECQQELASRVGRLVGGGYNGA